MTWKTMLLYIVVAIVVTGPFTGVWALYEPVYESPDSQALFDCGSVLHEHAPRPVGPAAAIDEPRSDCDVPIAHAEILAFSLIGVGIASWAVIVLIVVRRRATTAAAPPPATVTTPCDPEIALTSMRADNSTTSSPASA